MIRQAVALSITRIGGPAVPAMLVGGFVGPSVRRKQANTGRRCFQLWRAGPSHGTILSARIAEGIDITQHGQ